MSDGAFTGAKIALVHDGRVLTYLRDEHADIPFPAHWDLPGGGRENGESPEECALRELFEEFGLRLDPARIIWRRVYPSWSQPGSVSHFMGAKIEASEIAAIVFGDEGQRWEMMPVAAFLAHERAVPHFKARLRDFLDATAAVASEAEEGL
jgi:8-oxo-dGTP diphosphatase